MSNSSIPSSLLRLSALAALCVSGALGCDVEPRDIEATEIEGPKGDADSVEFRDGFHAEGTWMGVVEEVPVEVTYDPAAQLARIDVLSVAPMTLAIDWSADRAGTYLVSGERCLTGELPREQMPSVDALLEAMPESLQAFRTDGSEPLALLKAEDSPYHLLMDTDPMFMILRLDEMDGLDGQSARDDLDVLLARCGDPGSIEANFRIEELQLTAEPDAAASGSWIRTNSYFTNADVTYVGPAFQMSKSEYDAKYSECWNSPSDCRANFTLENGFRYGWHCGGGWGSSRTDWLDPVDAVCRYHYSHYWDQSANPADHERQGWCGMAAALHCRSDSDWFWDIWFLEFFHASAAWDSTHTFATAACIANGGTLLSTTCY